MKTKLLKKIRKRFLWSYSEEEKQWLVVDLKKEKSYFIDKQYAQEYLKSKKKPPCGWKEMKFRLLKRLLLSPYYDNPVNVIMFRAVKSSIKNKLRENEKI